MKKLILTLSIAIASYSSYAQNAPLYLWGTGLDGSTYQTAAIYSDATNGLLIEAPLNSAGSRLPIALSWRGGGVPFLINPSGNIGIGVTSPAAKLDIWPAGTGAVLRGNVGTSLTVPAFELNGYNTNASNAGLTISTNDGGAFSEKMRIQSNGNVGIGTISASSKLYIAGGGRNGLMIDGSLDGTATNKYLSFWQGTGAVGIDPIGTGIIYLGYDQPSDVRFGGSSSTGVWKANGNVLIGKTSQTNSSYKLDINGTARANEVVVNTTGADFVFEPNYKLPKLSDVKNYIDQNHHLPQIPSAAEMQKNGMSVGELNTKLLQKVEELTLYLIEQQKINQSLQSQINQLKNK